jgi:citrate lyase subunit beta / citryl-CoA lyase
MSQSQPIRSSLFVPGHKPDWVAKAVATGVDEIILDLEDAVPDNQKAEARGLVRASLEALQADASTAINPMRTVRVNGLVTGETFDDLEGIMCPALDAVILPKVESVEDMAQLDTQPRGHRQRGLQSQPRRDRPRPGPARRYGRSRTRRQRRHHL